MSSMARREFLGVTSAAMLAAGAGLQGSAPAQDEAKKKPKTPGKMPRRMGGKGTVYPDQRRKYKDSKTGHIVWQMTDTPGRLTHAQYFTQPAATPDGRWLIYGSDRGSEPGQLNLFKMDLETGESIQMTESTKNLTPRWCHLSPSGDEVYYIEAPNHFGAVHVETLEERSLGFVEGCTRPHQLNVSPDNKYLIDGVFLEKRAEEAFLQDEGYLLRSAHVVIRTDTGEQSRLMDTNGPLTHVAYCPADPNLVLYCKGGPWWYVQRMWLINADGTGNRMIFPQSHFEGAGHEFWSEDGKTIYVTCNGGRVPQGLWAVNVDGSNERCVLKGACVGHGTVNAQEDRFVIDDMYNDCATGMWMSKKGSIEPELLCQTGISWKGTIQEFHPHPKFLPNGKSVAFSSAMNNTGGEVYIVEV